jgi:hypothetical protein
MMKLAEVIGDAQNTPGFQDSERYSSNSLLMVGADMPPEYSPADLSELNDPPSDPEEGNVAGCSHSEADVAAATCSRSTGVQTRIDQDVAWPPASSSYASANQDGPGIPADRILQDEASFVHPQLELFMSGFASNSELDSQVFWY